jgi:phage recombination protein Bet
VRSKTRPKRKRRSAGSKSIQKTRSERIAKKFTAPTKRPLTGSEIELLRRTVAKGTTDDEFALFLWVCKKHKLDPLTRQIHCVRRWLNKHHQDEKGIWTGGYQMTVQMGIDGYRALAARDHPDFGGCDEPEYVIENGKLVAARIRLWKKGLEHPVVGVAYWDEFAPRDLEKPEAFFWKRMPKHMLAKCAERVAICKGYPELSDIYTDEEMVRADVDDYTPEGREIIDVEGSREKAQQIAQDKIADLQAKLPAKATLPLTSQQIHGLKDHPVEVQLTPQQQAEIWPKSARSREPGQEG